jgi:hypothetical protein
MAYLAKLKEVRVNRSDRKAWKSARTLGDLGELVVRWLNGEITETPDHLAPPDDETVPLINALTAINRGGFITVMSQLAESRDGESWNTWVDGFATDAVLERLRAAVDGTPLILSACRRRVHGHSQNDHWWRRRCQWRMVTGYWADRCPAVADALADCWLVSVMDPEPGRNLLLWGTLTRALTGEPPHPRRTA